ncbi:MAG: hypothetical protein IJW33_00870 [Lentisphaeria bacterium]|nr:hypothetical protein [Lentisphaeria bacterium]
MKELFDRCLNWISSNPLVEKMSDNEFCRGVIIGIIAGIVLLLVLRFILWLIFRRRSCSNIRIKNSSGLIVVNSSAIAGVIKKAVKPIASLEITRIKLYRRGKALDICLRAVMDAQNGTAPKLMDELSAIVRQQMKDVFGVENIRNIKLIIASCKRSAEDEIRDEDDLFTDGKDDDFSTVSGNGQTIFIKPPVEK